MTGDPRRVSSLENDPEGTLVDVPSPTEFDPGTTFGRYAAAATIVFFVAFVPGSTCGGGLAPAPTRRAKGTTSATTTPIPMHEGGGA